jgi:hypothetical protein
VVLQVNANVSEKHAVSIFGAEVTKLGSGQLIYGFRKKTKGKGAIRLKKYG